MSATPNHIIDHLPNFCICCGLYMDDEQANLTKSLYQTPRLQKKCRCGHHTSDSFPLGVDAPISYGSYTTALIAYLRTRRYITLARISELFASVYNMGINQGTVCGILDRFTKKYYLHLY